MTARGATKCRGTHAYEGALAVSSLILTKQCDRVRKGLLKKGAARRQLSRSDSGPQGQRTELPFLRLSEVITCDCFL